MIKFWSVKSLQYNNKTGNNFYLGISCNIKRYLQSIIKQKSNIMRNINWYV